MGLDGIEVGMLEPVFRCERVGQGRLFRVVGPPGYPDPMTIVTEAEAHRLRDAVQAHADTLATARFGPRHGVFTEVTVEPSEAALSGWVLTITHWSQALPQRFGHGFPVEVASTDGAGPLSWIDEDGSLDAAHLDITLDEGFDRATEPSARHRLRSRR